MKKDLIPISALVLTIVLGFGFTHKKEVSIQEFSNKLASIVDDDEYGWNWIDKVEEGKELLKKSPRLSYTYTMSRGHKNIEDKQIALAVLDTLTGEVFEKRIWVNQDDISDSDYKDFQGIPYVMDESYNPLYPMKISIDWWNSFNTAYSIEPSNYIVVANKYLMPSSYIPKDEEKFDDDYTDIVYVPYSKYIHQEALIRVGKKYLNDVVDQAYLELKRDKVRSQSDPNKLVIDSAKKEWIKQIIVTEHMDPDLLAISEDGGLALAERVYVIIGTNKDRAYYYTASTADARGISQFIRSTYDSMVRKYPQAGLITDYQLGTSIHSNVVKAMVLLYDNNTNYLGDLLDRVDDEDKPLVLAASYNGNPRWARDSIVRYGSNWFEHQSIRQILKAETFGYIAKLKALSNLDIWN